MDTDNWLNIVYPKLHWCLLRVFSGDVLRSRVVNGVHRVGQF